MDFISCFSDLIAIDWENSCTHLHTPCKKRTLPTTTTQQLAGAMVLNQIQPILANLEWEDNEVRKH